MAFTAKQLVAIAAAEVGYLEKKSNYNLDSKTANAGGNNWTKYARDLHKAGYYNFNKNGYAWCDVFVDWCFYQLCNRDAVAAQKIIYQTGDLGAGCTFSMGYYKTAKQFFKTPAVGDQIFFGTGTSATHTAIVEKITATEVHTIEGNTREEDGVIPNGGGVFRKSYALNDPAILGYGRPKYETEDAPKPATKPATTTTSKGGSTVTIELSMLQRGSKGAQVKTVQRILKGLGYSLGIYGIDGDFGATTQKRVIEFQKKNGLAADGIVGKDTWTALLKG
jgi:hypothetical protein